MKKLIILSVIFVLIIMVYNFFHQVYDSLRAGSRLDSEIEYVSQLQKRNEELKKQLSYSNSLQFLESQARDKLNMLRPGETVVVIPKGEIEKILGVKTEIVPEITLPNYQAWLKLFFK